MQVGNTNRQLLLKCMHDHGVFVALVGQLFLVFTSLYERCCSKKSSESYASFQMEWLNVVTFAFSDLEHVKCGAASAHCDSDATSWRHSLRTQWKTVTALVVRPDTTKEFNALGHAIAAAVMRKASDQLIKMKTATEETLATVEHLHEETEYSLFAIAGGCVQLVKRVLARRHRSRSARQKREGTAILQLLYTCVRTKEEKQRLPMPTPLRLRDRGGFLIPHRVFLLWLRNLDRAVRTIASEDGIALYGKNIIKVCVTISTFVGHIYCVKRFRCICKLGGK
ncbi:PREDICTED: uncharacterized protein LOC106808085 [Priapulus caudatus]|uniref:Uncharacterized protein LOC106808085 n=1 Tax=Priapulus caudatus TaxID=37621 RepID=A0ABM1E1R6_PRICU|nr:PREDICTED: uncharacterized protein LOC106808085 [Priapulus caudatus]